MSKRITTESPAVEPAMSNGEAEAPKPQARVIHLQTQIQVSFVKPAIDGNSGQTGNIGNIVAELTEEKWMQAYREIQANLDLASAMTREEFAEMIKSK